MATPLLIIAQSGFEACAPFLCQHESEPSQPPASVSKKLTLPLMSSRSARASMSGQCRSTRSLASPIISLMRASACSVSRSVASSEVRYLHAVIGITPRPGPDVLALCKAGGNEDLQCMFDLVVVSSNQRVLATGVSQSIAVRHYGDVEAPIATPH